MVKSTRKAKLSREERLKRSQITKRGRSKQGRGNSENSENYVIPSSENIDSNVKTLEEGFQFGSTLENLSLKTKVEISQKMRRKDRTRRPINKRPLLSGDVLEMNPSHLNNIKRNKRELLVAHAISSLRDIYKAVKHEDRSQYFRENLFNRSENNPFSQAET